MEEFLQGVLITVITIYIGVCFGKIAEKNGRNPILYGILSLITPVNLFLLGYWAFKKDKKIENK
ncbi:MAG: hypothetical protein P9M13_08025 [Candidatus Ancaeobacter aquaticus]|nr:hypothetical protein [Candidatus Ancaeobacter aquaticus]